jgi:hypothetical protein
LSQDRQIFCLNLEKMLFVFHAFGLFAIVRFIFNEILITYKANIYRQTIRKYFLTNLLPKYYGDLPFSSIAYFRTFLVFVHTCLGMYLGSFLGSILVALQKSVCPEYFLRIKIICFRRSSNLRNDAFQTCFL